MVPLDLVCLYGNEEETLGSCVMYLAKALWMQFFLWCLPGSVSQPISLHWHNSLSSPVVFGKVVVAA